MQEAIYSPVHRYCSAEFRHIATPDVDTYHHHRQSCPTDSRCTQHILKQKNISYVSHLHKDFNAGGNMHGNTVQIGTDLNMNSKYWQQPS